MITQVLVMTVTFPCHSIIEKQKEVQQEFQCFLDRWADFKNSISGAELNPVASVIVILLVGCGICPLNFPFSMGKRGQPRCMHYCYGERDHSQLRFFYA